MALIEMPPNTVRIIKYNFFELALRSYFTEYDGPNGDASLGYGCYHCPRDGDGEDWEDDEYENPYRGLWVAVEDQDFELPGRRKDQGEKEEFFPVPTFEEHEKVYLPDEGKYLHLVFLRSYPEC